MQSNSLDSGPKESHITFDFYRILYESVWQPKLSIHVGMSSSVALLQMIRRDCLIILRSNTEKYPPIVNLL